VSAKQLRQEVAPIDSIDSEEGLFELAEKINSRMPDWLDGLLSQRLSQAQSDAIIDTLGPQLAKLERSGGQPGARLALLQRLGREELPLAERDYKTTLQYSGMVLELDPLVQRAFTLLALHPDDSNALEPFWSTLDEAQRTRSTAQERGERSEGISAARWWQERAHLSRLARQVANLYTAAENRIGEGNDIIDEWVAKREQLAASHEGP
jgi:hypothetical protein